MLPSKCRTILMLCALASLPIFSVTCGNGGSSPAPSGQSSGLGTPKISRLSPGEATAGGPDFVLSVYGTNLSADYSVVSWNGQDRPTGLNCVGSDCLAQAPHIDAQISASDIATPGTVQITVYNPGTPRSNPLNFGVTKTPPPPPPCIMCVDEIIPSEIAAGGPGFTLTINGTGFYPGLTVMWDNMTNPTSDFRRPTTYISYNQMIANIPYTDIQVPGSVDVFVEDYVGGVFSNKLVFTIR